MSESELKKALDQVDRKILDLLNQRGQLALRWSRLKEEASKPEFSSERQMERLQALARNHRGPLSPSSVERIFAEIVSACRAVHKPLQVAFMGPKGSFGHMAALRYFGGSSNFMPQTSIVDLFEEVERGHCSVGVAPAENSSEGGVAVTLDQFVDSELLICGEIYMEISQTLLSSAAELNQIDTVYANPLILAQCRGWLSRNLPQAALRETANIAVAAGLVNQRPSAAAVGSQLAAQIYNLPVLASNIQDLPHNSTRFFVLGRQAPPETGSDKTSVMFYAAHRPGSLYQALSIFARQGLNMTRIESRPVRNRPWDYAFFLDFLGHREDPAIARTLEELSKEVDFYKWLGSYPLGTAY